MNINDYKDINLLINNLTKEIENKNNCKLQYIKSFNSFWLNDYENNELRVLLLENIRLTISRVSFEHKRNGTMSFVLNELIDFCNKNNIKEILVQSVLTKEMANFCKKYNFVKKEYFIFNEFENDFYGDYILTL